MIEELQKKLSNIKDKSPVLLLNTASNIFKSNFSGKVYIINNDIEAMSFIENYDFSINRLTVVEIKYCISDNILDKILDRVKFPIIVLAEDTNNISLLFRFKTVVKFSEIAKSSLTGASKAQTIFKTVEDKSNIAKFYSHESPELYYYKMKFSMSKYIDLFSSE